MALFCFNFDQVIIKGDNSVEYDLKNPEALLTTLRSVLNKGHHIAITDYSSNKNVIVQALTKLKLTPDEIKKIHVEVFNTGDESKHGKNDHIKNAMKHFNVKDKKQVFLIDHNLVDLRTAHDLGYKTISVSNDYTAPYLEAVSKIAHNISEEQLLSTLLNESLEILNKNLGVTPEILKQDLGQLLDKITLGAQEKTAKLADVIKQDLDRYAEAITRNKQSLENAVKSLNEDQSMWNTLASLFKAMHCNALSNYCEAKHQHNKMTNITKELDSSGLENIANHFKPADHSTSPTHANHDKKNPSRLW